MVSFLNHRIQYAMRNDTILFRNDTILYNTL